MNILVTGGAGFIGSNLSVLLKRDNPSYNVLALDNLKRRGSELNLPRLKKAGVGFTHGDIRNPEDLLLVGFRPDIIIECSAEPSVTAGYGTSPSYVINTNLAGTVNCLEAARRCGSAIIFLSTSRVYPIGKLNSLNYIETETRFELQESQPFDGVSSEGISERFPMEGARSLYGATKLCSEHMLEEYSSMYGLKYVINRCGVVAGPWQMGKVDQGVFVHWLGSHLFRKELRYFGYGGKGKQVRDLLHIEDLYSLVLCQIENLEGMSGMTFNAGGGRDGSLSLSETTALCADITGNRVKVEGDAREREADVRLYITDNSVLETATGWRPKKTPADVLTDIFDWMRANETEVKGVLFG